MRRWCLVTMVALVAGCGGGGDSGGGGSGVYTLELGQESGEYTISGQVSFPADTPSGHAMQFLVDALDSSPSYAVIEPVGNTNGSDEFAFRIVGASDGGTYQLRFAVDLNDSEAVDAGDLMGWNGGTVAAPLQDDDQAPLITIAGESVADADFGIGPIP